MHIEGEISRTYDRHYSQKCLDFTNKYQLMRRLKSPCKMLGTVFEKID